MKLTCTDNLSCLCAFEKGRTGDFKLNQLCRVAAAYQGACGIKWRLRHIETKRNPADRDSRFTQHSSDWGNRRLVHDRGKKKPAPDRFVPPGSTALPSSSLPAQTHSVGTATNGRAVPGGCGNQKGGDCRDRLKDKIDKVFEPKGASLTPGLDVFSNRNSSPPKQVFQIRPQRVNDPNDETLVAEEARPPEPGIKSSSSVTSVINPRGHNKGLFLELFAGTGRLSSCLRDENVGVLDPIELKKGPVFDMRRRSSKQTILAWIRSGRISVVHLGTPCTVFSRARHFIRHIPRAREKERIGLELALFSAEVIALCNRYKVQWSLENPRHSRLFEVPILADLLQQPFVHVVDMDFCMYGEPYKKPTRIFTTMEEMLELAKRCHKKSIAPF